MINYTLVIVATIAQFILGGLWYSPLLFGKWWMQISECTNLTKEEIKKLQKEMGPFYGLQLFLTLLSTFAFANFVAYNSNLNIYHIAWWIWIGFLAPALVGTVIWGNTKRKFWVKQIFVMLSYQLAGIMLAAFILSM